METETHAYIRSNGQKLQPKALLFDVFGTVVDWRTTVTERLEKRSSEALNSGSRPIAPTVRTKCAAVDWPTFAQEWRNSYYAFTRDQARRRDDDEPLAFKTVDEHHLDSLRALLDRYGIAELWTDGQVLELSRTWHHLDAWPDSSRGLGALREHGFVICTLSNGNVELLTDMAAHARLPWTHVFSAEMFGAYKPHPSVYTSACRELGLEPAQCAMVAAHLADLQAARGCELRTIYVERAREEAWSTGEVEDAKRRGWVDMWVSVGDDGVGGGILEIARNLKGEETQ